MNTNKHTAQVGHADWQDVAEGFVGHVFPAL